MNTAQGKGLIEAVEHLLAILAHEIRNPLNNASNAVALIERSPEDRGMVLNCAQIMKRQVGRISRLVDDLFEISTLNQGKMRIDSVPISVNRIMELAVDDSTCEMETKNHTFAITTLEKDIYISGDENRLLQVFCNLLSNAAKYTNDHGTIHFSSWIEGSEVVLSVQDNGIGISSASLDTIFELFIQENPDSGRGGIGLGLALVKKLVELHGGSVGVSSEGSGKGSTFYVRLPILDCELQEDSEGHQVRSRRILLVEDHPDSAKALSQVLEIEGHEVHSVQKGQDALCDVITYSPEIVLLDLGLPDMSGEEVAMILRHTCPNLCIIALTGYTHIDASNSNFDHYLTKPVDLPKLFKLLSAHEVEVA